ncbi:helix-turn-helix domain-containing protein [Flavobacterium sp. HSC-61S13]|uniref:helix-turn-helix domain-containing protein n=1 Tax=Flavobacterium sp. HSC-61S13 TaxID=2910963 RepID=UPI00209E277B|nr:helix-turn-helix domain-containing protein [Flavobacterium sp. HSC-61S13]MCP1994492.1 hypothetical protein [Flavobacterium sp. HSC-61S13]
MKDLITKQDLEKFEESLMKNLEELLARFLNTNNADDFEWLRTKAIRNLMNISAGTLQNLRITGKLRYRKVMGSYYYSRKDVLSLFQ